MPALGHSYSHSVTQPDCTNQGYTTHMCNTCGHTYTDAQVPAAGHSFGDWTVTAVLSCTVNGEECRTCAVCGEKETHITQAPGHSYQSVATEVTCTTSGYVTHTCTVCGNTYKDAHVEAPGHRYNAVVTAPTCTADGYTVNTCTVCGDRYVDAHIEAQGHEFTPWTVTAEATCVLDGMENRSCTVCGHTESQKILASGHSYRDWYTVREATCTETGSRQRNCNNCNAYEIEEQDALGHNHAAHVAEPTCTEQGYTTYICYCGDQYIGSYTEALGHDYRNGTCARCDEVAVSVPVITGGNHPTTGKNKISWEPVDGAVKYEIYRADSRNGRYRRQYTTSGTSYTNTTAVAGQRYYYYVRAIAADGTYADSRIIQRTCNLAQPAMKVGSRASDGAVTMKWEKISGATAYEIYRATSKNGKYTRIGATAQTEFYDDSVTVGDTRYYKVRAVCDNEDASSVFSGIKSRTRDLPQPEVKISRKNGKPYLSWDKVSGASKYMVYRATSEDGIYTRIAATTSRNYKDMGAKKGKTCYYKVVAVCKNTAGNSAYSSVVSIKSK